ncbi:capsular biosynthesis protein [Pontibacillus chungwhensis BH030062]|uniref:Capsular biosynthesis protein n=1 Tax=Pontibacillus chungwhensis BH030062 TaxID=1385513 RepID=A0A0A2V8G6_9BACI|nr:CapA family protein [Pontibacillus chungwhensis]KGP90010.1 capsular biosynthesis protein [Pontibacillus chungwhensis BH030062]
MKWKSHIIIGLTLLLSILFTPTFSEAKEKNADLHSTCNEYGWLLSSWTPFCYLLNGSPETNNPITLTFGGDVLMEYSLVNTMEDSGPDHPFQYVAPLFKKSDYTVINLETPITSATTPYPKLYNFKASPLLLEGLSNAGVDLVSLANNHTLDYNVKGLLDTFEALDDKGIDYIGAGNNQQEAYKEKRISIKNQTVAILAFSEVLPDLSWYAGVNTPGVASGYQLDRVISIIDKVKEEVDYVVVYYHWGDEKVNVPNKDQTHIAHTLVDHGVDAVIGSHPHVLQGFELYNGKPIAYSLGNFLFPNYVTGKTAETGVLEVTLKEERVSMAFHPFEIKNDQIVPLTEQEKKAQYNYLNSISFKAALGQDGDLYPQ